MIRVGQTLLLVIIAVALMIPVDALGVSRSAIDSLQQDITDTRAELASLQEDVAEKQSEIAEAEKKIDAERENLRQVKRDAGVSWDAALGVEEAERLFDTAQRELAVLKRSLISLLDERTELIRFMDTLRVDVEQGKKLLAVKTDLSGLTPVIGIDLARSCQIMINNNLETTCPDIRLLSQLDSSEQSVSGYFEEINGTFARGDSPYEKSWRWYYENDSIRLIVDPPADMSDHIPMITITPNLNEYFTPEDRKVENYTRTFHKDIHVDRCRTAIIGADNWQETLPWVIFSMRLGCPTDISKTHEDVMELTEIDITTSPNWQYQQWLNDAKSSCKSEYGKCK